MSLPVRPDYLSLAIAKERKLKDLTLRQHRIANIRLPTGSLIACDPLVFVDSQPFELPLPRGTFPVNLSIADFSSDQRVAFASIQFRESTPVAWDMLTLEGQDTRSLKERQFFGYGVDAGTGCFIDIRAARILDSQMRDDPQFYEKMIAEMDRTYVHTWSWLDMTFADGNLIAFSSGFGDGVYATYIGFDADSEISTVVTDFAVVDDKLC